MAYQAPDKGRLREGTSGAHVASVTAADAVAAAGANPTKAEYDVAVTELNSVKAQLNLLLVSLRASGALKTS
jgi:hypothetical protein